MAMIRLPGLIILSVALAASAATGQTIANGPYYATPSWDQKFPCDTQGNCPRFVVLSNWNNEAVLDRETGLVWQQRPLPDWITWSNAINATCQNAATGGRYGWRLPTLAELASLAVPPTATTSGGALPPGHPFAITGIANFWSANTIGESARIWDFSPTASPGLWTAPKSTTLQVWCVRGATPGLGQ